MKPANNFKSAQTHYEFILGPIKIKDGLFMGDELAAKDIEFIISNKVTHVINTVSKSIPNLWERFGIQYLSVNWTQKQQNIFDKKNNAVNAIFHFIQEAMQQGQSCLIHSVHGKSRACAVMCAYLMKKYNWSLDKCLQFVSSKKEHLEIRNNYLSQMQELEKRMMQLYNLSNGWQQSKNDDDLVLKNTFANTKIAEVTTSNKANRNKKNITWGQKTVIPNNTKPSVQPTSMMTSTMTRFRDSKDKKNTPTTKRVKSILKGFPYQDQNQNQDQTKGDKLASTDTFPSKKDNNFISAINGNIVHVTVNNFINTDKKSDKPTGEKPSHLGRPYSSDNKDRLERESKNSMNMMKVEPKKNLFAYDNHAIKSPYDSKLASKIASNSKLNRKKEEIRNPMMAYERPQSANIAAERRKMKNASMGVSGYNHGNLEKKEDMMVTGKKRYPSTNPRDQLYKWK